MYCPFIPHLPHHIADGFREFPGADSDRGLTAMQIQDMFEADPERYPTFKMLVEPDGLIGRGLMFRRYLALHLREASGVQPLGGSLASSRFRFDPRIVVPRPESLVYYWGNSVTKHVNPSLGRLESSEWPNGEPRFVIQVECRHCSMTHVHSWHHNRERQVSHRSAHCAEPTPYVRRCGYYIAIDPKLRRDALRTQEDQDHRYGLLCSNGDRWQSWPGARKEHGVCVAL